METQKLLQIIRDETGQTIKEHRSILDGWDNTVIEVNGELIYRFTRRKETQLQHVKELELLHVLNQRLTLSVPDPIYHRITGEPTYYMAYKRIPGEPLTRQAAEQLDQTYLLETITSFLSELQDTPYTLFKHVPTYPKENWRAQYRTLYETIQDKIIPRFDTDTADSIHDAFKQPLNKPDYFDFIPTLIHRDLTSDHILHKGDKITGVIDWGDACFGDPAFDLTGFLMGYNPALVKEITAELEVPDHCLDRVRFYAKVSAFYGCLYGLETGDDALVSKGLDKIRKVFK